MSPCILQFCRQIVPYTPEATPELYAKTVFAMEISDTVRVSDRETGHDMEKGRARVWPLRGMGYRYARNLQVHASDKMRGNVEPHDSAKFESLNCYANLDFYNEDLKSHLRVHKDHRFIVEDKPQFGVTLRQSDVIRNFVSLLLNSAFIDNLFMMVAIPLIPDVVFRPPSLTKEEDAQLYEENLERKSAADSRGWELFLDNNLLAPLEMMSNVRRFELRPILPFAQPQQHYVKMIQDLKEKIERNRQLSQAAKNSN